MSRFGIGAPPPLPETWDIPVSGNRSSSSPLIPNTPLSAGPPAPLPIPPVQVFPWWLYEYESATDFYISSLNFAVPASVITVVPSFTFTVPQQQRGVLKSISMTVQSSTAAMNLSLTLLKNNAPIQGWTGIPFPPILATGENINFNDMNVKFQQGEILTAQFTEASAAAWTCSLTASGWTVAKAEIDRLQQGVRY